MIISFSGLDGSGKTSQIDLAMDHLKKRNVKYRMRHAIRDSFAYFLLHGIIKKITPKGGERLEEGIRQDTNKVKLKLLSAVKKMFLILSIVYFRLRYGFYRKHTKKALVCDRYFYDELIQARYLKISGRLFDGIYEKLIVKPDIAFLLEVNSEEAHNRKKEYDLKYFMDKSLMYEDMKKKGSFIVIPSQEISRSQEIIQGHIDEAFSLEGKV